MKQLLKIRGMMAYTLIVFLNAMTDLGHKIIIQNTVFKSFDGTTQIALTAVVNALILLPFVLMFSPSGYLSDRFHKHKVIRLAAAASIPMAILITFCYYRGWFYAAFIMTLLLAAQSAIYSPAKYGYIKELTGKENLAVANALVQAVTIVAILAGAVLYSLFFERLLAGFSGNPDEILRKIAPLGFLLIIGTILETLLAFRLPERGRPDPGLRFRFKKYITGSYLKTNLPLIRRNRIIWLSIIGLTIFWAVNQVVLAGFGAFLKEAMRENSTVVAQGILSIGGLGIIVGSALAGKVSRNFIETGLVPVGALGMTISLFLIPHIHRLGGFATLFFVYGMFGGMLIVPLNSLIQFNAKDSELGKVLAGNNFVQNVGMLLFLLLTVVVAIFGVGSVSLFYLMALVVLAGAVYTVVTIPQFMIRYILRILAAQGYRLKVSGLNNLPSTGGVMLLGNHISWVDWALLLMACPRTVRFVMERDIYEKWYLKWLMDAFKVVPIAKGRSRAAIQSMRDALSSGDVVALFPEGTISRNGQLGYFHSGFERAAKETGCAIVPFYLHGIWGSYFSFATRKLRKTTRQGHSRKVAIRFGKPMADNTPAPAVKQAIMNLSARSWHESSGEFPSLPAAWFRNTAKNPSKPALMAYKEAPVSRRELLVRCICWSRELKRQVSGPAMGILLPVGSNAVTANLSAMMRGKQVMNLNPFLPMEDTFLLTKAAGISTVLTSRKFLETLTKDVVGIREQLEKAYEILYVEDFRASAAGIRSFGTRIQVRVLPRRILEMITVKKSDPDDIAVIACTRGRTGRAKGVCLSHRNLSGNIRQLASVLNLDKNDIVLGIVPPWYAAGLTVATLMPIVEGVPLACHENSTDTTTIGKLATRTGATVLYAGPDFLDDAAKNRELHPLMLESLRMVVSGFDPVDEGILREFKVKFGIDVYPGYGLTEATTGVTVNVEDKLVPGYWIVQQGTRPGTLGLPLPGTVVRVENPETGAPCEAGTPGRIVVGGPQVMAGYLDGSASSGVTEENGFRWLRTDDTGSIDTDGFLVFTGKEK